MNIITKEAYVEWDSLSLSNKRKLMKICASNIYRDTWNLTPVNRFNEQAWKDLFLKNINSILLHPNNYSIINGWIDWSDGDTVKKEAKTEQPVKQEAWWGSEDNWKRGLKDWINDTR